MISRTILTLVVIPAVYALWRGREVVMPWRARPNDVDVPVTPIRVGSTI